MSRAARGADRLVWALCISDTPTTDARGVAFVVVAASLAAFRVTSLMVMILALPNLDAPENSPKT